MDAIEKWLKSLRLHKYTHLFKSLTYEQMLNLEENYLIEQEVTKGARNKMLVSVKKLNLRQDRLINMIDDLNQDNISMKEALTVLKDMLITPIPPPLPTSSPSPSLSIASTTSDSPTKNLPSPWINNYLDPYRLTYLFIETLEKVAHRLIESAGMDDNACHGIMAAIIDECLKHNSFTKEQKAQVASFKQYFNKEPKVKAASNNFRTRPQTYKQLCNSHAHQHNYLQNQQQMQQQQKYQHQLQYQRNQYKFLHNQAITSISPSSLSASLSTLSSDEEERMYGEYSLLGPGTTFELPCLRAAAEKLNQRQLWSHKYKEKGSILFI